MLSTNDLEIHCNGKSLAATEIWNAFEWGKTTCNSEAVASVRYGWKLATVKRVALLQPLPQYAGRELLTLGPWEFGGMSWQQARRHATSRLIGETQRYLGPKCSNRRLARFVGLHPRTVDRIILAMAGRHPESRHSRVEVYRDCPMGTESSTALEHPAEELQYLLPAK